MKKVLAVVAIVVGLMAGGASVGHAAKTVTIQMRQLSSGGSAVPGLPPDSCVGAAANIPDIDISSPGPDQLGVAIYLPAVLSTRLAPIGFGELPPNPCEKAAGDLKGSFKVEVQKR